MSSSFRRRSGSRSARTSSTRPWQYTDSETETETDREKVLERSTSTQSKIPWQHTESESEIEKSKPASSKETLKKLTELKKKLESEVKQQEEKLKEQSRNLEQLIELNKELESKVKQRDENIKEQDRKILNLEQLKKEQDSKVKQRKKKIKEQAKVIKILKQDVELKNEFEIKIKDQEEKLDDQARKLSKEIDLKHTLEAKIKNQEEQLSAQASNIHQLKQVISKLQEKKPKSSVDKLKEKKIKKFVSECKVESLKGDIDNSVVITLPSGQKTYPSLKDKYNGTLCITFQPIEPGLHLIEVPCTDKERGVMIPFIIEAVRTSGITAYGDGLHYSLITESGKTWIEDADTPLDVQIERNSFPFNPSPKIRLQHPPANRKSRCELSVNIPVTTVTTKADLIFALDCSTSVGVMNIEVQLSFIMKFIQKQKIGPDHVQCSFLTFSSAIRNGFFLNKYHDKDNLLKAIEATEYESGKTFTGAALKFIREETLSAENGSREDCRKLVIVFTDGASTNTLYTLLEAEKLKACHNVTVISIGVSKNTNIAELKAIATNNDNVFRAFLFEAESSITKQMKCYKNDSWSIRMSCLDQRYEPSAVIFHVKHTSPFTMEALVTDPDGEQIKNIIDKISDCQYAIQFFPKDVGIYKVEVRKNETPIVGSPFELMVEPRNVDEHMTPQEPAVIPYQFQKDGVVKVIIKGASKPTFSVEKNKNGK